jgi:hypothetical protein
VRSPVSDVVEYRRSMGWVEIHMDRSRKYRTMGSTIATHEMSIKL